MNSLFSVPDKKITNKSLFSKCHSVILDYTNDTSLQKTLTDYLVLRLSMKDKPMYGVNQWKGLLKKLNQSSPRNRKQIVEQSIEKGWATFVVPDNKNFGEYKGMSCSQGVDDDDIKGVF